MAEWGPTILYCKYLLQIEMFDSLYFLRGNKVVPNILHITMRRSVSIHLLYNLGLVSYVSAKIELRLKQFNAGGGGGGTPGKPVFMVYK